MSLQVKKHFFYIEKEDKYGDWTKHPRVFNIVISCFIAVFLLIALFNSYIIIPTGYTGVKTTFGQIDPTPIPSGFSFKIPFVQGVKKVNNKQQDEIIKSQIWSETSERTAIYYEGVNITYTISPEYSAWLCANVSNYTKAIITDDIVNSAVKSASKQLNSTDATNRSLVEPLIQESLQSSLTQKYNDLPVVFINKVTVSNIDFEDTYNAAIAEKQNAQITYEQQQIANKKAVEKAEADAQIKEKEATAEAKAKALAAQGEAEALKISSEAEAEAIRIKATAEAEANKKIADSLTGAILDKMYYDTWDGKLPTIVGDAATPIYTISNN